MNAFLLLLIAAVSSAAPAEKSCAGLLAGNIQLNRTLRLWADAVPLPQEWLLPKAILRLDQEPLTANDRLAAMMSENKLYDEVAYYEAVDAKGDVLLTSEFAFGDQMKVNSWNELLRFLRELSARYPRRSRGYVAKIRMVHTRPPNPTRDFFSYADAHKLLFVHATLEVLGGNEIELEESILHPDFTKFRSGFGEFVKRSLFIPAGTLSWVSGHYMLDPASEEALHRLQNDGTHRPGYALPNAWQELGNRDPH